MTKYCMLGIARSGIAAAKKIREIGEHVYLSDNKPETDFSLSELKDFECEFGGHSDKVLENDILIVSPGIPLNIPILQKAKQISFF